MSANTGDDLYSHARRQVKSKPALTIIGGIIVLLIFLASLVVIGYTAVAPDAGVHWVLGGIVLFSFSLFAAVELVPFIENHTGPKN